MKGRIAASIPTGMGNDLFRLACGQPPSPEWKAFGAGDETAPRGATPPHGGKKILDASQGLRQLLRSGSQGWHCPKVVISSEAKDSFNSSLPLLTPHSSLLTSHSSLLTPHSSLLTKKAPSLRKGLFESLTSGSPCAACRSTRGSTRGDHRGAGRAPGRACRTRRKSRRTSGDRRG